MKLVDAIFKVLWISAWEILKVFSCPKWQPRGYSINLGKTMFKITAEINFLTIKNRYRHF